MDEERDNEDDMRAPLRDELNHEMKRRIDKLERWQIAADLMIKDQQYRLGQFEAHMTNEFKDQNTDIKRNFDTLNNKLDNVISDQMTWAIVRNVFKWLAVALGSITAGAWAIFQFAYDHYHHNGVK